MLVVIRDRSGDIHFKRAAASVAEAFSLLAESLGFTDFESLCVGLRYTASDFEVSIIQDERFPTSSEDNPSALFESQRRESARGVFRFLRRNG